MTREEARRQLHVVSAFDRLGALRAARRIAQRHGLSLERVVAREDKRRVRRELVAVRLELAERERVSGRVWS